MMEFTENRRDLIAHAVMALTVSCMRWSVGMSARGKRSLRRVTIRDALSYLGEALNDGVPSPPFDYLVRVFEGMSDRARSRDRIDAELAGRLPDGQGPLPLSVPFEYGSHRGPGPPIGYDKGKGRRTVGRIGTLAPAAEWPVTRACHLVSPSDRSCYGIQEIRIVGFTNMV